LELDARKDWNWASAAFTFSSEGVAPHRRGVIVAFPEGRATTERAREQRAKREKKAIWGAKAEVYRRP